MKNEQFLKACRKEKNDFTPVWLMRQAGRYMEEYRKIRSKVDFLTMCKTPELAAEVTMQPVNKIGIDAAIIFADILLPLEGMGINLEFAKNEGPVISNPVRTPQDVDAIRVIKPEEDVPYLIEAIKLVRKELDDRIPLIGFSSAPFTLASYIIEGSGSRNYTYAKNMMYSDPDTWNKFMGKIVETLTVYLKCQIEAGAQTLQIFDSWVGCLSTNDYREYVLPHSKKLIDSVKDDGVPIIHFGTNTASLLPSMREAGGDILGVDWRTNIDEGWEKIGFDKGCQGNLDPVVLFSTTKEIRKRVEDILKRVDGRPGHIFNLGHGLLPETPVDNVIALVDMVHELSSK